MRAAACGAIHCLIPTAKLNDIEPLASLADNVVILPAPLAARMVVMPLVSLEIDTVQHACRPILCM